MNDSNITFARLVRDTITHIVTATSHQTAIKPSDLQFFDQLNQFLINEGEPPIAPPQNGTLPSNFAQSIADALDQMHLSQQDNAFNAPRPNATRESERARSQLLGDLYGAIANLLDAHHAPYIITGERIERDSVPPEDQTSRLWKRVMHRTSDGRLQSELVPADHIDFSKRPVICFGGNNGNNLSQASIMSTLKHAEHALGGLDLYNEDSGCEDIELYCISHPACYRTYGNAVSLHFNADPEHNSIPWIENSFTRFLKPQLETALKQDSAGSTAHLKAALRQFNFFCSSMGSACVKSVRNHTAALLHAHRLTNAQIKEALAEAFVVMVDPTAAIDYTPPEGNFTSVYVISRNDRFVRARSDFARFATSDHEVNLPASINRHNGTSKAYTLPHSDNELLIVNDTPVRGVAINKVEAAHRAEAGEPSKPSQSEPKTWAGIDTSGHNVVLANHMLVEESDEPIRNIRTPEAIHYPLRNAVARRDQLGDVASLMESTQLTTPRFPYGLHRIIRPSHTEAEDFKRRARNDNTLPDH